MPEGTCTQTSLPMRRGCIADPQREPLHPSGATPEFTHSAPHLTLPQATMLVMKEYSRGQAGIALLWLVEAEAAERTGMMMLQVTPPVASNQWMD